MTNSQFGSIPSDVREYLKLILHINPELRPDAGQVMKVSLKEPLKISNKTLINAIFNLKDSVFR